MGRVLDNASMSKAAVRESPNVTHTFHSGRNASVHFVSMKVANASFSQMPFHHLIVTRSPNHMCATSWWITTATFCNSGSDARAGSTSRSTSRNVMHPKFSIAPNAKSGTAIRSTLSPG